THHRKPPCWSCACICSAPICVPCIRVIAYTWLPAAPRGVCRAVIGGLRWDFGASRGSGAARLSILDIPVFALQLLARSDAAGCLFAVACRPLCHDQLQISVELRNPC